MSSPDYKRNIKLHSAVHANSHSITTMQCEMCLQYTRTEHPDYPFLDNGSQITINGGYGEFFDTIDQPNGIMLTICHDCTLKLFRMIPKLSADKINRLHSVSYFEANHPLCCEYSWTIDEQGPRDESGNRPVINGTIEHAVSQTTYPAPQVSKTDDPEWIAEKMFGEYH